MTQYPVNTFQNALELGQAVCDSGGANSTVQKSVIAHALKSSDRSGAFIQRLATVLLREFKVPESWKDRVARFFLKAAAEAEVLGAQGFLRYSASRQSVDHMPVNTSNRPSDREISPPTPSSVLREGMNVWV